MGRRAPVTTALLIIIAVVFGIEALQNAWNDPQKLEAFGAITGDLFRRREYWRLITSMFMHAGWLHWAANSFSLYQLGTLYEVLFGSRRFALIYFTTGIIAGMASAAHLPLEGTAVGASGAIFGVLGAFIFSIRRSPQYRDLPWTRGLISQLVFWIAVNIVIGLSIPHIDNIAHIGGLVAGLLLGFLPHRVPPPPPAQAVIEVEPHDEAGLGSHLEN